MPRLPLPGQDAGQWGSILNDYLSQAHTDTGALKPGIVTGANLAADAVGANALADGSVTANSIADDTIAENKLDTAIRAKLNTIASGTPTAVTMGGAIVGASNNASIAPSAVTSSAISDSSVTAVKLADNAVTSSKIINAAIAPTKLDADTPANGDILSYNGTTQKFEWIAVPSVSIPDGSITGAKLVDGSISAAKLDANAQNSLAKAENMNPADFVNLTSQQSIGGGKTFVASPTVPAPTLDNHAATKAYVDRLAIDGEYWTGGYVNNYEFRPYNGLSNEYSIFTGWAGAMGAPQDFDTVTFKIKNRDTTSLTNIRVIISNFNKLGTVLVDKLYSVNIAAGQTQELTLYLSTVIANASAGQLYFAYQSDKLISMTSMNLPSAGDNTTYGRTAWTSTSQSLSVPLSSWTDVATPTIAAPWVATSKREKRSGLIPSSSLLDAAGIVKKDNTWQSTFTEQLSGFNMTYFLKPFSSITYTTSTFSGWGSFIGTPQNFSAIKFKVQNRASNAANLTQIRVYLMTFDKFGTQLASGIIASDIAPGAVKEVIWNIGKTIENSAAGKLYFIFQCNQTIDLHASTITPDVADGTYCGRTAYSTNGAMVAPASMLDVAVPTSNIIWTEVGTPQMIYAPTDLFAQQIAAAQTNAASISYDPTASGLAAMNVQSAVDELKTAIGSGGQIMPRIILPNEFVAVVGDKLQLYVRAMIEAQNPYTDPYEVSCPIGKSFPRYYELTPTLGDVGTKTITVALQDNTGVNKVTATSSLVVVNPPGQPATNKNVLCVGDSLTDRKPWPGEMYRRLTQAGGTPVGLGYSNISFIGTDVMLSYPTQKQTGRAGWTWGSYVGQSTVKAFTIQVPSHDKDNTDQKSLYTDSDGKLWLLETIATTSMKVIASGHTSDIPASGTLTWSSGGVHTSVITYTSATAENSTPFWDSATSQFSFTAFMNNNGYSGQAIDIAYILLGWNGMPGQNKYQPSDHVATIDAARIFLNKLHEQYPTAKARVMGIQVPSVDGGLGTNYGASGTYSNYYKLLRSANGLNLGYQALCNEPELSPFTKFLSTAHQFDSEYNMPASTVAVNTRNTATERLGNNGVHPETPGYMQIADVAYRDFLRSF